MFSVTEHEHKENDADDVKYVVEVEFNLDMAWSCVQISSFYSQQIPDTPIDSEAYSSL